MPPGPLYWELRWPAPVIGCAQLGMHAIPTKRFRVADHCRTAPSVGAAALTKTTSRSAARWPDTSMHARMTGRGALPPALRLGARPRVCFFELN
jgi:hypothetical protein